MSGFELNCGAYELGHLVMHSQHQDEDVETQASAFAAEFLMPEHVIRPQLRALTLGRLLDLKQEWGVPMQALMERAHALGAVSAQERQGFYKRLLRRGWRKQEPGSDTLPPRRPAWQRASGRPLPTPGSPTPKSANSPPSHPAAPRHSSPRRAACIWSHDRLALQT
ncbi:ImmA/IrrE family metallo-endopeptidase [Actinomyces succiniciruminis]|uniref:ImmA/IrrE family metallo-endopeptidase n=1 Tax=Actinomyces succiniciruminis TaxID=1522002 RepID=UPI003CC80EAC